MKKEQESLAKEKSQETRTNVASGTPDATNNKPAPGTSGTWGGGWGKPVTDQTPEELLENQ